MNIILTKILLTNDHRKHPTTLPRTTSTNAANVGVNLLPLPVLGKSVITAKNQSVKSAINAANVTVAVNVKAVKDIDGVKDTANQKDAVSLIANRIANLNVKLIANRIANTNAKRNRANALKLKKLFTTTVANAL